MSFDTEMLGMFIAQGQQAALPHDPVPPLQPESDTDSDDGYNQYWDEADEYESLSANGGDWAERNVSGDF